MKDLLCALVIGSLCAAVVACGSRGDQAWLEDSGLSPFAVRVQGNWWAECAFSPDIGLSRISALFMNHELFRRTTQVSWSTECNTWDEEIVENYDFFVNGDVGNNERELELHLKNITAKPVTRTGAAQLNQIQWCGISDWMEGVSRDITTAAGADSCMPNRQQEIKTVITIQGDTLMIGQMDNVATARTLDTNQVYRRPPPATPTPVPERTAPIPTPPPPTATPADPGPTPGDTPPQDDTLPHARH